MPFNRPVLLIAPLALALLATVALGAKEKAKLNNRVKEGPSADPAVPHIAYAFPAGGQRGTAVKVALGGQEFTGASAVHVSGQRVTGTILKVADDKQLRISLTIAPDAEIGERDLRVITPGGMSNRIRFMVSQFPELLEAEPNSKKSQPQRLPAPPIIVNAQAMLGDIDYFQFHAKAGQKLVLQVQARVLIPFVADAVPGWMQPTLAVYNAAGREVAYQDDFRFDPDPVVVFDVPTDGDYVAEIKDALLRGREDFVYRLSIAEVPFISDIFPLGARRGTTARIELHGANLPEKTIPLKLAKDCASPLPINVSASGLTSNTLPFAAGDLQETRESEPNDASPQAQRVQAPVTINGRIGRPNDVDCFSFAGESKHEYVIEVCARRLGSPLDSVLSLLDSKGNVLAKNDDTSDPAQPLLTHQADSRIQWKCPAAGDYYVRLGDTQSKGGPEYAYRLTISSPRPDFALRVLPDNPRIAPGDTAALTAEVIRKDGFNGEVQLSLKGVPESWLLGGAAIPKGETQVRFTITAPAEAEPGLLTPKLIGTATIAGRDVQRQAWPAEDVMQAFSYQHRPATQEFLLSVIKPSFYTLRADAPEGGVLEVPQNGEAKLTVHINRKGSSDGPLRITLDSPPKGVFVKPEPIPPGTEDATVVVSANQATSVGTLANIVLAGKMRLGRGTVTRLAPSISIKIVPGPPPAPATATAPANAAEGEKKRSEPKLKRAKK